MSDIPEDIREMAYEAWFEAQLAWDKYSDIPDPVPFIARAIMAEQEATRERCAQIVKTWGQDDECIQPMFGPLVAAIRSERAGE